MKAKPKESAPSVRSHWHQMNRKQRRDMERKIQSADLSLQLVHPDAAGVDIGNECHYVAVPPDRDSQPVRHFGCTTAELRTMADWLKKCTSKPACSRMSYTAIQYTPVDCMATVRILPGERAGHEEPTGAQKRRAGESMADEAAYLRAVAKFIPALP